MAEESSMVPATPEITTEDAKPIIGDTPLFEAMRIVVERELDMFFRLCSNDEERSECHATAAELGQFLIDCHTE